MIFVLPVVIRFYSFAINFIACSVYVIYFCVLLIVQILKYMAMCQLVIKHLTWF